METKELDLFDEESGLAAFREKVEKRVPIPYAPEGRQIVVDEKELEYIWPFYIAKSIPATVPPEKYEQLKGALIKYFNRAAATLPFDASELDNEAAETKRTLLMTAPEKFENEEKIPVYKKWLCICHALVKAGAHIDMIETSLRESSLNVFTRDRYVMIGDTAYLTDAFTAMSNSDRERGQVCMQAAVLMEGALEQRGIEPVNVDGAYFEGGNVIRHFGSRTIFVGTKEGAKEGTLYAEDTAQKLLAAINTVEKEKWSVLTVPLTNARMYHMDTGMSEELPHGEVLISPLLTDPETYQKICDRVGLENVIEISDEDANNLATNLINVGDTLVTTCVISDGLQRELTARGYTVVTPADYGEKTFELGHGGVHCATNDVPQPMRKPRVQRQLNFA